MRFATLATVATTLALMTQAVPASAETGDRSPAVGAGLSAGGTALAWTGLVVAVAQDNTAGAAAGAVGVVLGPSLGPLYGGRVVTTGLVVRAAAAAAVTTTLALCTSGAGEDQRRCGGGYAAVIIGGTVAILGATTVDILKAPRLVRSRNRRVHQLAVAPLVRTDGGGLVLAGQF